MVSPTPGVIVIALATCSHLAVPAYAEDERGIVARLTIVGEPHPPFVLTLAGASETERVPLLDDGEGVDVGAGDGTYTGAVWMGGDSFEVTLETGMGVVSAGTASWATGIDRRDLVLALEGDFLQVRTEAAVEAEAPSPPDTPVAPGGGLPPTASDRLPGSGTLVVVALLAWIPGLVWALFRLRSWIERRALQNALGARELALKELPEPLPQDSVHCCREGDPATLAAHLAHSLVVSGPVVVLAPSELTFPSAGSGQILVFEGQIGKLGGALRALAVRSFQSPVLVALIDPSSAERIRDLAFDIPTSTGAVFVVREPVVLDDTASYDWSWRDGGWQATAGSKS